MTDQDIELAGAPGASAAQRSAREKLRAAFSEEFDVSVPENGSLDIDLPLTLFEFPPPDVIQQRRFENGPLGNWFDPAGGQVSNALGISPLGRETVDVRLTEGVGLRGTGAGGGDGWTVPGTKYNYDGGGDQVVIPNEFKGSFTPINPGRVTNWRDDPSGRSGDARTRTELEPDWEDRIMSNPYMSPANKNDIIHYLKTGTVIDSR